MEVKNSNVILNPGSVFAPSIYFDGYPTTGMYSAGPNEINFTITGNKVFSINNSYGVVSEYDFWCNADIIGKHDVVAEGRVILSNTEFPALIFANEPKTGIGRGGVDTLSIVSNWNEVARFNDSLIQFTEILQWDQIH